MEQRQNIDPMVAIVMGSKTDSKAMMHCKSILDELEIPCQAQVISAHRMLPCWLPEYWLYLIPPSKHAC
jgi:phosphoribosylcarboxyaminoimidazole (NCAIR) mutase